MQVLSLFDGISCGQQALKEAGIPITSYYASEIDRYAIAVTQKNHPATIQLGDVSKVSYRDGVLYSELPEPGNGKQKESQRRRTPTSETKSEQMGNGTPNARKGF